MGDSLGRSSPRDSHAAAREDHDDDVPDTPLLPHDKLVVSYHLSRNVCRYLGTMSEVEYRCTHKCAIKQTRLRVSCKPGRRVLVLLQLASSLTNTVPRMSSAPHLTHR